VLLDYEPPRPSDASAAWNSPSALMIFRAPLALGHLPAAPSPAACRSGSRRPSPRTIETLMPHGPVAWSMIVCRIALILSRSESSLVELVLPRARSGASSARSARGRDHEVLDLDDRVLRRDDPEVRDGVHAYRHIVLRDHVLRRDVEGDRPQVDLHHPVDDRDEEEEARVLSAGRGAGPSRKMIPLLVLRGRPLTAANDVEHPPGR